MVSRESPILSEINATDPSTPAFQPSFFLKAFKASSLVNTRMMDFA
jgi:hypothetical protein